MQARHEANFRGGTEHKSGRGNTLKDTRVPLEIEFAKLLRGPAGQKALNCPFTAPGSKYPRLVCALFFGNSFNRASISGNRTFGTTTAPSIPTSPQVTWSTSFAGALPRM